jgi:acetyl/propionyl-CoA carboxylase alpha subunit
VIESVLIANRGEIARRIIRTARRLGARSIAVYSDADAAAPHVAEADQAIGIGPAPATQSYLDAAAILLVARMTDAQAIHPGYGFLSENADFADQVLAAGLVWVGPPPAAIRAMGLKDAAKRLMAAAGVPVTPGYLGDDQSPEGLVREAAAIGWPVMIKAVAGGGGKGMRRADSAQGFAEALAAAKREAASAFGDDRVLLERFVSRPRHLEVQVFADTHGAVVHLFERDCSLQRRHQKVIEEAPAPDMDEPTRRALCDAAVRAAKAVDYVGAGTVEFIADASHGLRADRIWFMEMNTRLQVEHPVTEAITGLDLVEWQLRVAAGEPLPLRQDEIQRHGHAVEARLYAEDPGRGFLPSTGRLAHFSLPAGVRVDSGVEAGGVITPYYDPMVAKLIAHAPHRAAAVETLAKACGGVEIWPVMSNAGFLVRALADPDFRAAHIDTGFIEARLERLAAAPDPSGATLSTAASLLSSPDASPWTRLAGFRVAAPTAHALVQWKGKVLPAPLGPGRGAGMAIEGGAVVFEAGEAYVITLPQPRIEEVAQVGDDQVRAPMPGRIASVPARPGARVTRGQTLATLEAMKMEHALTAPFDGVVAEVFCAVGDQVQEGALLVQLTKEASPK